MTPVEAIQAEIEREQAEIEAVDEELDRLFAEMRPTFDNEAPRFDLVARISELLRRKLKQGQYEEEIRGKQEALQAIQNNPDKPFGAIGEIIDEETRAAMELGRRAQRLRQEAWRAEQEGNDAEAQKKREDAKKLGDRHILLLARLRGKHTAGREVQRVLRNRE